jgi:hypothetical protein
MSPPAKFGVWHCSGVTGHRESRLFRYALQSLPHLQNQIVDRVEQSYDQRRRIGIRQRATPSRPLGEYSESLARQALRV